MTCHDLQQQLLELFGEQIPENLQQHINSCDDCRAFYEELQALTAAAGSDDNFRFSDEELAQAVENVDTAIDEQEVKQSDIAQPVWKSYVPIAAALVLVLSVALVTQMFDILGPSSVNINNDSLLANNDVVTDIFSDDELTELADVYNESNINTLYDGSYYEADLTEEEYQYLEENLDVGELL